MSQRGEYVGKIPMCAVVVTTDSRLMNQSRIGNKALMDLECNDASFFQVLYWK